MIIYHLSCGCILPANKVKKYNNKIYCPEHNGRPVKRINKCKMCKKDFVAGLTGIVSNYCKDCQILRKKTGMDKISRRKRKTPKLYPIKSTKRKYDCAYYSECLSSKLLKNAKACADCPDYTPAPLSIDEFISNQKYNNEVKYKIEYYTKNN